MYAPLPSLARRLAAARLAPATIGRTALLALPVLFLLTGPPWLLTRDDAPADLGQSSLEMAVAPAGLIAASESVAADVAVDVAGEVAGAVAGLAPVAPAVPWLAAAVVVMACYLGHRLRRGGQRPTNDFASDESYYRTAYGVAVGLVGLAALEVAVGGWFGVSGPALAVAVNLTAIASGAAFLGALLTMPGGFAGRARVRLLLDGVIVGLCLMFCAWVLLVTPLDAPDLPALSIVFCCCVLATALLFAAGPWAAGHGPVLCAAGVGVAMAGLPGLSFALVHSAPAWWLAVVVTLLLAAPLLVWYGLDVRANPPTATPATSTGLVAGAVEGWTARPGIAWPSALALAVASYRLATGAGLDRTAVVLGTLAVLGVGLRHVLVRLAPSTNSDLSPTNAGVAASDGPAAENVAADGPAADGSASDGTASDGSGSAVPRPRTENEATRPPVHTDPVTGLADAVRLAWSIAAMRSAPRSPGALLLIGIDGLDTVPGAARDDVVREAAARLRRFLELDERDRTSLTDVPARWSAAELALLTPANLAQAYGLAHRVAALLAEPIAVPSGAPQPSVCVGVTDLAGASSTEDAVHRAQVALRRARQLGPGRVEWYDPAVAEVVARREILERDLPDAVRRGELDLIYQPIIDLERGRPLAVEALLRWRHPQFGTLLPADVIPVAEEIGTIVDVDRWALWRAMVRLAIWRQEDRDLSMAINVSPRTLETSTFADEVATALGAYDLPPNRLVVEVAEAEIEDGTALDEGVGALREIGVRTALDAFGTGTASLTHLRRLPIDMVKIGKPFFEAPTDSGAETPMIDLMVGVGRRLGVDVVAQGVEAPAHLTVVRSAGCRIGQGHLFARPQPAEQTEAYLDGFVVRS